MTTRRTMEEATVVELELKLEMLGAAICWRFRAEGVVVVGKMRSWGFTTSSRIIPDDPLM
jgi:hypothetical protein